LGLVASRLGSWVRERNLAIRWTYGLCSLVLIAAYPLLPELGRLGVHRLVFLTCLAAIVVGARASSSGAHQRWLFLLVAGLVIANVSLMVELVPGERAFVFSGVLNAAGNVVLFAAAMAAVFTRVPAELGGVADLAIVGLAVGGLVWNFAVLPRQEAADRSIASEIEALLVVVALAGVLGALVRVRQASESRRTPLWVLVAALIFALASHIVDALAGNPVEYAPVSITSMAAVTCVALFGLDTTTYRLLRPGPAQGDSLSRGRLWFMGVAVATIPVAVGVSDLAGRQVNGALLIVGGGLVTAIVMARIHRLSTERLSAEQALRDLASHDPLTGLVNRREFMARLADARSRSLEDVILFCDLDRFKDVNDRLGHAAGDQLLVEVANRLQASVRGTDTVARLGGDEFIILLSNAGRDEVSAILRRASDLLAQPIVVTGQPVAVCMSIGVVLADALEPEELLKRADRAMYDAKQSEPRQPGVRITAG